MNEYTIVPELNYWMRQVLKNAQVYDTFHKIPVEVSEEWRNSSTVLELMFNETFDPEPVTSSSSSIYNDVEFMNDRRFIYTYRRCNLLKITDKVVLNRTQIYRWWAHIYAANTSDYLYMFDMQGSVLDPGGTVVNNVFLPFDVNEEDRSPYITYQINHYFTSNYPLHQITGDINVNPNWNENIIIGRATDVFDLSDSDLDMLDLLYDYKTELTVTLDGIVFDELSCIGKLVYIYLDAFINNSFEYYDDNETISDGSDILCTLYEKHVIDMLYLLRRELYGVQWKEQELINDRFIKIDEDIFVVMKRQISKVRVTVANLLSGEIIIPDEDNLPWNRKDFFIFKDGSLLEQDVDYSVEINYTDPENVFARVVLLTDVYLPNELLEFIWSYVNPYSAYSEIDE